MQLACAYVNCGLVLLVLSSFVTGETNTTHSATKNADDEGFESDGEQNDAYSDHMLPHLENGKFEHPPVIVQQLCPRGLRMWIPGLPEIRFVAFHVSINNPLHGATPSEYSGDLGRPTNGRWQFDIPDLYLQKGDQVYYWLHFVVGSRSWLVTDLAWTAPGMPCSNDNSSATSHCKISASKIPKGNTCSGQLLFEDNFDVFDLETWHHEVSASGGRHSEFQIFVNNRSNSFVRDGKLHLRATLTRDVLGEEVLYNGILDLRGSTLSAEECTNPANNGCYKQALGAQILNPVMSAQLQTSGSFTFQYGTVKMRAKMPRGDWLWPAVYLLPYRNAYGSWPGSGQIIIVQSRGNALYSVNGEPMGTQRAEVALHFGPGQGRFIKQHINCKEGKGWNSDFHEYELEWTPEYIKFSIDNKSVLNVTPPLHGGFWIAGGFSKDFAHNTYRYGSIMAPFDQQFSLVISLAVGGLSDYFPDNADQKPWNNTSPTAALDFWERKDEWYPSWEGEHSDFQVDYIQFPWNRPSRGCR